MTTESVLLERRIIHYIGLILMGVLSYFLVRNMNQIDDRFSEIEQILKGQQSIDREMWDQVQKNTHDIETWNEYYRRERVGNREDKE